MTEMKWGSDAVAAVIRDLGFEYIALVPGSSFRGLHDSLVNYLGDEKPSMLVCLHEEHAVAIAHGYAKVSDRPMAVALHANVGLMHASMAIYNAWCDRAPVVVFGATGPMDAAKRRPWIDWIHTARDQAAMVRSFTKWDDQPGSPVAAVDSIVRATQVACTAPAGPTYVVLEVSMQEEKLSAPLGLPERARYAVPIPAVARRKELERAVDIMRKAKRPVVLVGRCNRSVDAWNERIALAEALNALVVTDYKAGASFPTDHPLHVGRPSNRPGKEQSEAIRSADAILSLESIDLGGVLKLAFGNERCHAAIIAASVDRYIHNGASMDYQLLPPVDLDFPVAQEQVVTGMLELLGNPSPSSTAGHVYSRGSTAAVNDDARVLGINEFSDGVEEAFASTEHCYIRLPLSTGGGSHFVFRHPLDYLGADGGGGLGAGPGMAVGAALALRGTDRIPVAVLGDGDFLMGVSAIWTAVAGKIPLLVIVANNRCFYNDVVHQERMARDRDRPVERKWVGQMIHEPAPDMAMIARGQGAIGIGPVEGRAALSEALAKAITHVRAGNVCVVDVIVAAEYDDGGRMLGTGSTAHATGSR